MYENHKLLCKDSEAKLHLTQLESFTDIILRVLEVIVETSNFLQTFISTFQVCITIFSFVHMQKQGKWLLLSKKFYHKC